jgi:hypothetical protein
VTQTDAYRRVLTAPTRSMDNDVYGYTQFAAALVALVRHKGWAPAGLGLARRPRDDSRTLGRKTR